MSKSFELAKPYIGKEVTVTVDRPVWTSHHKRNFIYPINYGYVKNGPIAPDREELDAYVLGIEEPVGEFVGTCVAVIHRKDDDDDKLVVVSESKLDVTDREIEKAVGFQEQWFDSEIRRS